MRLRKITFNNSLKHISQSAQTQPTSKDIKPNTIKKNSLPKKQIERISQNKKIFTKISIRF